MKRIGVLLAAGRSTRMGRPKQLLAWPPNAPDAQPLVAAAFDAILPACDAMVVVVGHEADAVIGALGDREFGTVAVEPGAEMIESVKAGLSIARAISPKARIILHPADHPHLRPDTLRALTRTAARHRGCAVMPTFGNQGGHPVIVAAELVIPIVCCEGEGGLRQFWLDNAAKCVRLPVDDPGVVFDIDTPSDYGVSVQ
jgi:molybdenum cofactor cytidylyltransferase